MNKRYILNGFESQRKALERNQLLTLKSGNIDLNVNEYLFNTHCLIKEEWGLEIGEEYIHLLDDIEKTPERLKEIPFQPFIAPYIPMVFRYLEKKWVDNFFEDGSLRISSFKKFHQHSDEQRGDKQEGNNLVIGVQEKKYMYSLTFHGSDAFVLSTSLLLDKSLYSDFDVDSCFVIEKPFEFMDIISKQIPNFKGINFGPCLYQPLRQIRRNIKGLMIGDSKNQDTVNLDDIFKNINEAGGSDTLFLKTQNYSSQHEYRFLWHSFDNSLPEHLDIKVPEAREFCRRIQNEDL